VHAGPERRRSHLPALRLIGPGRAGSSLALALSAVGWRVEPPRRRGDALHDAATGVDLLVIATPDEAVAEVAAAVDPVPTTVVAHLSGSLGLDVLAPHARRAALHPLVPLPDPETGAVRLTAGAWFAVAGEALAGRVVADLGGRAVTVADPQRAAYHAAAAIASNHLVALLGQVERVAAPTGVGLDAFLDLARAALADVAEAALAAALTGPVARGDTATVRRHLAALEPTERLADLALAAAATRLREPVPGTTATGVLTRASDFRAALDGVRAVGLTTALVPTMGALHEGHLSLVRRAAAECDVVAVTIFVNPLQFGSTEDLVTAPRDLERDVVLAVSAGADVVFAPPVEEMYPEPPSVGFGVGPLGDVLEGASRPGHFAGVATVVAKLFNLFGAGRAYFGEKDWQQLLVVRRLVADLSFPVEVVGCPTVREPDGLACSSRNLRLSAEERAAATVLHRALARVLAAIRAGERDPAVLGQAMADVVAAEPLVDLDYATVLRATDLAPLDHLEGDVRALVAARVGSTRLIDNVGVTLPAGVPPTVRAGAGTRA
jgi:pantoate--beta-alanine ligase